MRTIIDRERLRKHLLKNPHITSNALSLLFGCGQQSMVYALKSIGAVAVKQQNVRSHVWILK